GGEKQKNPTRSSFFPTKNQGLEWMSSNPRMQIAFFVSRTTDGINWQIFGNNTPNCDRNPVNLTPPKIMA
ncbi:hypothetical protein, partial [Klebsiella pneumoniae]|uniref:hypothetical protein n=1 Tax=Klebsiella pneumoniae TaxID=573 RepID=UPI001F2EEF25